MSGSCYNITGPHHRLEHLQHATCRTTHLQNTIHSHHPFTYLQQLLASPL